MLRVDGAYLYSISARLRPVAAIPDKDANLLETYMTLAEAKNTLNQFVYESVFSSGFRTLLIPVKELVEQIDRIVPAQLEEVDWSSNVNPWLIAQLKTAFNKFEHVMIAELQTGAFYYVLPKGGFDTTCLTDNGQALFPFDLPIKVPDALDDIKAATRCIAFELPTAAGFHLHRANETVVRAYFDAVAGQENRPASGNMGQYIAAMNTLNVGDPKVRDVLKSIKDLHRNPLMHPGDSIESIDDALSLCAAIRAAIGYMLSGIPMPLSHLLQEAAASGVPMQLR